MSEKQDVNALAKEANKTLRNSQRAMFNGKLEQAQADLDAAVELIEQIKTLDPAFGPLKGLEGKYAKQKGDLDRRLPKAAADVPTEAQAPAATPSADKLPGGVSHRLKQIDRTLARGEQVLTKDRAADDWKAAQLDRIIDQAKGFVDEIMSGYGDQIPPDHPEVQARQARIAGLESQTQQLKADAASREAAAAQQEAQCQAQSDEWLAQLRPYLVGPGHSGYDEATYLIPSGTEEVEELQRRKTIYEQAAALFAEYQAAAFPHGKTDALEQAEKELAYALENFGQGYQTSLEGFYAQAREKVEQALRWLDQEEAKEDGERPPALLPAHLAQEVQSAIARAAAATPQEAQLAELEGQWADIQGRADRLRQLRQEHTRMTPDQFQGEELGEIKAKAAEFLHKEHPAAQALRTTVISPGWKEEKVLEHTDTTRTEIRYRVTRSVTAQIAGQREEDVLLYTLHVAQDRSTDGDWGAYYGHVMFTDPMLKENLA